MNQKRKERIDQIRKVIEDKLDERDKLFAYLQEWFDKYGSVPKKFLADWNTYQKDLGNSAYPWRKSKKLRRKVRVIAQQLEKNEQMPPDKKADKADEYLKKQLRKIGRA